MNFRSYFYWLIALVLTLSSCVFCTENKPSDRKCVATCMDYCVNDSESGIPLDLCNNACMTMCFSARRDVGSAGFTWEDDE